MNGYVKNISPIWRHAMKRSIGPGHQIELDDLYSQYGKKHDIEPDENFVRWLRQVKLQDSSIWHIHYVPDADNATDFDLSKNTVSPDAPMGNSVRDKKNDDLLNIINLSVRQAREYLNKINDIKLLNEAYRQANQVADKRTLCLEIRKRIKTLETSRR